MFGQNRSNQNTQANNQNQEQAGQQGKSKYSFGSTIGGSKIGSGGSKWGGYNFNKKLGAQNANLIQEEMTISKIEEDSEKNPDLKNALKIIFDINERVTKYGQKMKPIDGSEAFEKKLAELKDETDRAIVHKIMALAREIDHGNEIISEYRNKLETFKFYSETAKNGSRTLPSPLLVRYYDNLKKQTSDITRSIQSFTEYLDASSNLQSPQMLTYVLQQQNEAIIRCAARISQIKTKSEDIQKNMKERLKTAELTEMSFNDENNTEKSSYSKTVMDEYEKFKDDRIRDLKKRNTDREQWKKAQQQKSGLGVGLGKFGTGKFGLGNKGQTASGNNASGNKLGGSSLTGGSLTGSSLTGNSLTSGIKRT